MRDIQIGEEAKPRSKEEVAKAEEADHQARYERVLPEVRCARGASARSTRSWIALREDQDKAGKRNSLRHGHGRDEKAGATPLFWAGANMTPQRQITATSRVPASDGAGLADESAGPREMAGGPAQSSSGARGCEPFLAGIFRQGIVKTSEDFGSQGEPPSNQLLLDWLATEFVRSGWNVKPCRGLS